MKLGKETGSVTNWMMGNSKQVEPAVGMGVTMLCWSDRHAGTIVKIEKGIVFVQRDFATRVDKNGMSECQTYEYSPNPEGTITPFKQKRNGQWKECQKNDRGNYVFGSGGDGILFGDRDEYYDFSM